MFSVLYNIFLQFILYLLISHLCITTPYFPLPNGKHQFVPYICELAFFVNFTNLMHFFIFYSSIFSSTYQIILFLKQVKVAFRRIMSTWYNKANIYCLNLCKNFPTKYHLGDFVDSKVYAKIYNQAHYFQGQMSLEFSKHLLRK